MKRIAFVINTLSGGGAERTISNITTHLPNRYIADIVVNDNSEPTYPYLGNLISLNLKPVKNKLQLSYQFVLLVKRVLMLRRIKRERGYVAVYSFSESANIANILSGNKFCKVILSVRNHLSSCKQKPLYRMLGFPMVRCLYSKADRVVAVSEGVAIDLKDNFGVKNDIIDIIPNACDVSFIDSKTKEPISVGIKEFIGSDPVIATMGRLERQKGQWHLIRALSMLKSRGNRFKLIIMGDGSLLPILENAINENDMVERVYMTGFCLNPFSLLSVADIFVLPSLYEGMGNSIIEALACGLPCISTDHDSGAREILAPDTDVRYKNTSEIELAEYGILIPVCDGKLHYGDPLTHEEYLMSTAIERLMNDSELREHYHKKASERANMMNLDEAAKKWIKTIEV